MKADEFLDILGETKGSYVMEAQAHRERRPAARQKPRSRLRFLLIAAVLTALLAGCTYAVLKLQDLKMGMYVPEPLYEGETFTDEELSYSLLSLQGFEGSVEYQAAREWVEFEQTYDPDPSEVLTTDGHDFISPERYDGYITYTQAQMDKVDEICAKYGLEPLGKMWFEDGKTEFIFEAVGIPGVLSSGVRAEMDWYEGVYFEAGTFDVRGRLTPEGADAPVDVSYRCARKGVFDGYYSIDKPENYEEWEYRLKDGAKALMVLGQRSGRIIADREDCFIMVWLDFEEAEEAPTRQTVEAFAELFSFNIHPQKVPIEVLRSRQDAYNAEIDKGHATGMTCYDETVARIWSHFEHPEWLSYLLRDHDGDGVEDLIIGQDGYVLGLFTLADGQVRELHSGYNVFPILGGTPDYLYEGGVVGYPGYFYQMVPRLVPCKGDFKRVIVDMLPLSSYPLDEFPEMDPEFWDSKNGSRKRTSLTEFARGIAENNDESSFLVYDLDGDGREELLYRSNSFANFYGIYTMADGHVKKLLLDAFPQTLCQGGVIESAIDCGQGNMVYRYFRLENGALQMVDYLRLDHGRDPGSPWFRSTDGTCQDTSLQPISEEKFNAVRQQYAPMDLPWLTYEDLSK